MRLTQESIEVIARVAVMFNDGSAALKWLTDRNKDLDGSSPLYLINTGRAKRVLDYVRKDA